MKRVDKNQTIESEFLLGVTKALINPAITTPAMAS
jgi:hypothetical protein